MADKQFFPKSNNSAGDGSWLGAPLCLPPLDLGHFVTKYYKSAATAAAGKTVNRASSCQDPVRTLNDESLLRNIESFEMLKLFDNII